MAELTTDAEIAAVLHAARTIAVLGAHEQPSKPAFHVPDYLHAQGYHILPVNPVFAGKVLWGETVRSSLAELDEAVDIVDVFRRPERLLAHLDDLLAMRPAPKLVWLQLGIRNDRFAQAVEQAGIGIVQDHCALTDHRRLRIGPRSAAPKEEERAGGEGRGGGGERSG